MEEQLSPRVAEALAAAEIRETKRGGSRHARLSGPERTLYLWILRRFATSGRPTRAELAETAARVGADLEATLATLAREDLVHLDDDREIAVAYPFSGRPTAHHVRFSSGHRVDAMCAIDALGIAPMFGDTIEVESADPRTREPIHVRLPPSGAGTWEPAGAVVVTGAVHCGGDSFGGCCPALNFFAGHESAQRWLEERPDVRGHAISLPDAIAAGQAVFGAVLDDQ